ncbi:glycine cleavage system H protein [Neisseria elongata]|uniref:glycine cleavage system H protein n=1 Tax=Neisseria elongata TaxID=495 RepID=UPI000D308046|nr:glycine cleavage system H protein [Neisseria elongata]
MPSELYVSREVKVFLGGKTAPSELLDYLYPRLAEIDKEAAEQMQGEFSGCVFSIADLSAAAFARVRGWILEAAEKSEWIKPYKADLKAALEADPRFMAEAA